MHIMYHTYAYIKIQLAMVRICCLIVLTVPASTAMVILPVHAAFLEVVKVTVYTGFIAENVRHTTSAGSAVRI